METLDGEVVFGFVVAETNIHKKNLVGVSTCFLVLSAVKPFVEKLEVSSDESNGFATPLDWDILFRMPPRSFVISSGCHIRV